MTDEKTIFERLLAAQKEITAIPKEQTNPHFDHKYADVNAILKIIKPVLNKHGLLLMQTLTHIDGKAAITTTVMCETGKIEATAPIPEPPTPVPGKRGNTFQDMGSAFTYWRRYALAAMFALEAEDDDANSLTSEAPAPTSTKGAQSSTPKKDKPKEQPKAQSKQAGSEKEIPTCSICHQPMKPQKTNPDKFFCKHEKDGNVQWGKEVYNSQQKVA